MNHDIDFICNDDITVTILKQDYISFKDTYLDGLLKLGSKNYKLDIDSNTFKCIKDRLILRDTDPLYLLGYSTKWAVPEWLIKNIIDILPDTKLKQLENLLKMKPVILEDAIFAIKVMI